MTNFGLTLKHGVVMQSLGADVVLMDVNGGNYFELNQTGALMLNLLLAGADRQHVLQSVVHRFDVQESQVSADLDELMQALHAQNLVEAHG